MLHWMVDPVASLEEADVLKVDQYLPGILHLLVQVDIYLETRIVSTLDRR